MGGKTKNNPLVQLSLTLKQAILLHFTIKNDKNVDKYYVILRDSTFYTKDKTTKR